MFKYLVSTYEESLTGETESYELDTRTDMVTLRLDSGVIAIPKDKLTFICVEGVKNE